MAHNPAGDDLVILPAHMSLGDAGQLIPTEPNAERSGMKGKICHFSLVRCKPITPASASRRLLLVVFALSGNRSRSRQ